MAPVCPVGFKPLVEEGGQEAEVCVKRWHLLTEMAKNEPWKIKQTEIKLRQKHKRKLQPRSSLPPPPFL